MIFAAIVWIDRIALYGFACDETESCMPLSLTLSRDLAKKLHLLRSSGTVPWLRTDGNAQVTVQYRLDGGAWIPVRIHTVLLSAQHLADAKQEDIERILQRDYRFYAQLIPP